MTTHIPTTDPLCQELQGGHDSYPDGLLLADGHTEDPNGNWLIEAPEVAPPFLIAHFPVTTTAYVHPVCDASPRCSCWQSARACSFPRGLPSRHGRHEGRKVYGIRFWALPTTTTKEQA